MEQQTNSTNPNLLQRIQNLSEQEKWHLQWVARNPEYEERPVDTKTFIESPLYMNAGPECWEPVKKELSELFVGYDDANLNWKHNEAVLDKGIGAGKSYEASVIITYFVYRTLILREPQKFLGLAKGSSIYFLNMSIRGDQAKKVVFGEIVQRVKQCAWFENRGYVPSDEIKSELQFPKNICVIPGNSRETYPLGLNILAAVMDEAAWYVDTEEHDVAEEIYNALNSRIVNRFGNKGMIIVLSSPRYVDDFIERKMKEAQENPKIFARRCTSWECKPASMFSGNRIQYMGYDIPVEYETVAKRDFERFKRDYMAMPSLALEPYFKNFNLIEQCIDDNMMDPMIDVSSLKSEFRGESGVQYYVHIDLSLVKDATGIAMVHRKNNEIYVDLLMKLYPPEDGEIDITYIRDIILKLKEKGFYIAKCTYDQFQSASSIQELNKRGIASEQLSVDRDLNAYGTLKEAFYSGKLHMYRSEELLQELRRLELIKGIKVDHPHNASKDLSDALAGAVYNCITSATEFSFGFAGKKPEQIKVENMTQENLVPYGFYSGRRY